MVDSSCPYIQETRERYEAAQQRVDRLWSELSPEQLVWRPGPDRWSIAECVDHLSFTMDAHLPRVEAAVRKGREKGKTGGTAPYGRGTWFGRLFLGFLDPARAKPKKLKTPNSFATDPAQVDPEAIGTRFRALNNSLLATLADAEGLDLGKLKVGPPPTNLVKLSLAQGFQVHVFHHHRHLDQADRVRAEAAFPAA